VPEDAVSRIRSWPEVRRLQYLAELAPTTAFTMRNRMCDALPRGTTCSEHLHSLGITGRRGARGLAGAPVRVAVMEASTTADPNHLASERYASWMNTNCCPCSSAEQHQQCLGSDSICMTPRCLVGNRVQMVVNCRTNPCTSEPKLVWTTSHGTVVSSILAGSVDKGQVSWIDTPEERAAYGGGIAPDVRLYYFRVNTAADMKRALEWMIAANLQPKPGHRESDAHGLRT
jgi:hypothetical protein